MGRRGPQPTPTAVLKARGSRIGEYERDGEPVPPRGVADCPAWVLGDARQHWKTIGPQLRGMGVMSPLYTPALGLLVNSLGRYIEYENRVTAEGATTITDKGNAIVNPTWAARNKAWDQVMKALREFGMTPAALTAVRAEAPNDRKEGIAGSINPRLVG